MGYSYGRTKAGGMALACDNCGAVGGVRKRPCPYKVTTDNSRTQERRVLSCCPPPAMCSACWKTCKDTAHAKCEDDAARSQAEYDAVQARLDAGEMIVISVSRDGMPSSLARVTFGGAACRNWADFYVPADAYQGGGWLSDYPQAVPAPGGDGCGPVDGFEVLQEQCDLWRVTRFAGGMLADRRRDVSGERVAGVIATMQATPATCTHPRGELGCDLLKCDGVPPLALLLETSTTVSEQPQPGEPSEWTSARELAFLLRDLLGSQVTAPVIRASSWRANVRQAYSREVTVGDIPVQVINYEARPDGWTETMWYAAVFVDGRLVAGDVQGWGTGQTGRVARAAVPHIERALDARAMCASVGGLRLLKNPGTGSVVVMRGGWAVVAQPSTNDGMTLYVRRPGDLLSYVDRERTGWWAVYPPDAVDADSMPAWEDTHAAWRTLTLQGTRIDGLTNPGRARFLLAEQYGVNADAVTVGDLGGGRFDAWITLPVDIIGYVHGKHSLVCLPCADKYGMARRTVVHPATYDGKACQSCFGNLAVETMRAGGPTEPSRSDPATAEVPAEVQVRLGGDGWAELLSEIV